MQFFSAEAKIFLKKMLINYLKMSDSRLQVEILFELVFCHIDQTQIVFDVSACNWWKSQFDDFFYGSAWMAEGLKIWDGQVFMWGHNLPTLGEIALTGLPRSRGLCTPLPSPPSVPPSLQWVVVVKRITVQLLLDYENGQCIIVFNQIGREFCLS